MFTHLRSPGGTLGKLSIAAALLLGILGVLGLVTLLFAAAVGNEWWSDTRTDQLFGAAFFGLSALGAVGFEIMDRQPLPGATLAVIGSLALGTILVWTLVIPVLALGSLVVAVLRARELMHSTAHPHGPAHA